MKLQLVSWLLGAAAVVSAALPGRVVLLESPTHSDSTSTDTVSPRIARLIFAQRLGLSDDVSIAGTEPLEIQQVDRYGGPQQHPMTGATPKGSRVLIVVDGVEKAEDLVRTTKGTTSFNVIPAPHPEDTMELLSELSDASSQASPATAYAGLESLDELSKHVGNDLKVYGDRIIMHISSLARLSYTYGEHSAQLREEVSRVQEMIEELRNHDDHVTMTLAFMPAERHCSQKAGGAKAYGSAPKRNARLQARSEVPMHSDSKQQSSSPVAPHLAAVSHIPRRFSSLAGCERATANCTGHGECKLVQRETVEDRTNEYFSCVCNKPQVIENKDGSKQTTYFGGAACQKKDVSAPFWLLAGTTIFLVTIISMGIGLLYSMGSEELPSVIGAGVSGPRAK